MKTQDQSRRDWTVMLRRRPGRMVAGQPEGGRTGDYEIVCCDCGDDPDRDWRQVSPALRAIRGPYPVTAGITAYLEHAARHPGPHGSRPVCETAK
jgi:hypothetical protein